MRPYEEEALAWTNKERVQYGIGEPLEELPPDLTIEQYIADGESVSLHCPMAVALDQSGWGCGIASFTLGGKTVGAPEAVRCFQLAHDQRVFAAVREAKRG